VSIDDEVRLERFKNVPRELLVRIADNVLERAAHEAQKVLGAELRTAELLPPGVLFVRGNMGGPWHVLEVSL
jgi:hypothetical protein